MSLIFSTSIVKVYSILPALEDGERIIFNKIVYIVGDPDRGAIIIIQHPEKNYVKRIIGLPNETIEMRNHELYVNDIKQDSSSVDDYYATLTGNFRPITIPDNNYFVMGDNRQISKDSLNGLVFNHMS